MRRLYHFAMAVLMGWCVYDTANTHVVKVSWWAMALLFLIWCLGHAAAAFSEYEP